MMVSSFFLIGRHAHKREDALIWVTFLKLPKIISNEDSSNYPQDISQAPIRYFLRFSYKKARCNSGLFEILNLSRSGLARLRLQTSLTS